MLQCTYNTYLTPIPSNLSLERECRPTRGYHVVPTDWCRLLLLTIVQLFLSRCRKPAELFGGGGRPEWILAAPGGTCTTQPVETSRETARLQGIQWLYRSSFSIRANITLPQEYHWVDSPVHSRYKQHSSTAVLGIYIARTRTRKTP